MGYTRPTTPAELAEWRVQLLDDDRFWRQLLPMLGAVNRDLADAEAIRDSLRDAALWWVGTDCCQLLAQAAPAMPSVSLTEDLVPDHDGFAFLQEPIVGKDAWNPGVTFAFDCIQWMPTVLHGDLPSVSIIMWNLHAIDQVLRPTPLGRSDWPFGYDTDQPLDGVQVAAWESILEDRQLLAALWQLTSQPELVASTEQHPYRAAAKRIARRGYQAAPVRLVYLNRRTTPAQTATTARTHQREYTCQWVVRAHWRQQAYGPGRSLRRARWITQQVRGPVDKPLRVRDSVKVWTKP